MLILHISDIHFRHPFCDQNDDPDRYVRNELLSHASQQIKDLGDVDAMLVSGDIAFRGIAEEYAAATKWLESLAMSVGCNKRRIYVVPGNHDVDRNVFEMNPRARDIVQSIKEAGDNGVRNRLLTEQLSQADSAPDLFSSIEQYNLFAAKHDCQVYPGRMSWSTVLRIDSRTALQIYGLNSTVVSGVNGEDGMGSLFMGAVQLGFPRTSGAADLIMAHHPPEWMSDQDQLEMRLYGTPSIVLFGHRHQQAVRRDHGGSIVFSAGSVNPDRGQAGWEPAYNLIELTSAVEDGQRRVDVMARQFRWQRNPNGFVPKIDLHTGNSFFVHQIPVEGENEPTVEPGAATGAGGILMSNDEPESKSPPEFVEPDIRDIIYRFWELEPRKRRQILDELGVEHIRQDAPLETMEYRTALVSIARANRLGELEAAIAEKEG